VGTAYREASTLAYADAFRAIMIAFVIAIPLMRNVVLACCSLTARSLTRALATDVTIQRGYNTPQPSNNLGDYRSIDRFQLQFSAGYLRHAEQD
jgi:hypothetical protein